MFYPTVVPHNPRGPWLNKIDSTLCQEGIMYIWDFMVLWFMRKKYVNDPTLFLHFCDHPLFEKHLALHLNKLEFPSCMNGLYQFWLQLTRCFILMGSFHYIHVKIVSPFAVPPDLLGQWFVQAWICTKSDSFYVNMSYFGSTVLKKKHFQWPHPIYAFLWLSPIGKEPGLSLYTFYCLHSRTICTTFEWNWPAGSGEDFSI
jgi:hypothetical protein